MSTSLPDVQLATVDRYTTQDRDRWDAFVHSSRNGTFLFLRGYLEYHADRFPDHSFVIRDKRGDLIALLPAHAMDGSLISHGGLTYGGFVVNERMTATMMLHVLESVVAEMLRMGFVSLVYKSVPHIYHSMPTEEDRYALFRAGASLVRRDQLAVLDFRAPILRQERRKRALRKALRQGVTVHESRDLRSFWDVLASTLGAKYGVKPVHSVEEMELLRNRFPENIRLFCAYRGSEVLGGVVLYVTRCVCHAQYIAASDAGKEVSALDVVFDHVIELFGRQTRYFDFGISTERAGAYLNEGLAEFKEGFGARTVVHDHYQLDLRLVDPDRFRNPHTHD